MLAAFDDATNCHPANGEVGLGVAPFLAPFVMLAMPALWRAVAFFVLVATAGNLISAIHAIPPCDLLISSLFLHV